MQTPVLTATHPATALNEAATRFAESEALAFPQSGGRMTFAQWRDTATSLALGLKGIGLRPGDHVALLAENRLEWPVVQLAAALMGAVFVPLNTHYRRDDLAFALNHSDARTVITSRAFRSNGYLETLRQIRKDLPGLDHVVVLDGEDGTEISYRDLLDAPEVPEIGLTPGDANAISAMLFTSGTTGFPKATMLRHDGMMANAAGSAERLAVSPEDRWTSIIPLFHCAGCIMNILGCLQSAACYVGVPAFDPRNMFDVIETERCTLMSGVPTSYLAMLDHPDRSRFDLASLRAGTCGGTDCDSEILRRCARQFPMPGLCQVYGQTENSTLATCPDVGDPERLATAGKPLPGCEIRITDTRHGAALPASAIGQIEVRGIMTMAGYYKDGEATAEVLDNDGWLKTGDLGSLTECGRLVASGGRLRDMIIRGGENIYPAEIENLLQTHPAVRNVSVFAIPDAYYGEAVAAAVQPASKVAASELIGYCRDRIARFKVPASIFTVESFPMTPSGKIRKTELRAMAHDGLLDPLP